MTNGALQGVVCANDGNGGKEVAARFGRNYGSGWLNYSWQVLDSDTDKAVKYLGPHLSSARSFRSEVESWEGGSYHVSAGYWLP